MAHNFISLSDSVNLGLLSAYIVGVSSIDEGMKECVEFSKRINCINGSACGVCQQCSKINRGEHSDVLFLPFSKDDDSEEQSSTAFIKIDDIRRLHSEAYLKPFEGKRRIFIIKNADMMTDQAQNSILKILEESPSQSIIVLLTDNIYGLLSTIRSRCRTISYPFSKKLDVNYKQKVSEINNVVMGGVDMFFDYAKTISQSKESMILFLETIIVIIRDSISIKNNGNSISDGIDDILINLNFKDPIAIIDKFISFSSMVKSRSINKELVAINALSVLTGKLSS